MGRRRNSWAAALLAAAVLTSGFLLAPAQEIPVTAEPAKPLEGQGLTLTPGGARTFLFCNWYRGEELAAANRIFSYVPSESLQSNGPGFTGRETRGPGCSLRIGRLTLNDAGDYAVTKTMSDGYETGHAHIEVLEKLPPPILRPAELFVEEHADVTLNCTTSRRSGVAVSWFKDGKAVPAKAVLSERDRALTVPDARRDDAGTYTCQARNLANSAMSNPSKINVTQSTSRSNPSKAVAAILLGTLAVAALAGTLLYCFFRARSQKNKSSKEMNPVYENTGPSAQTQVVSVNSLEINDTYEELQHGSRDMYDHLRR